MSDDGESLTLQVYRSTGERDEVSDCPTFGIEHRACLALRGQAQPYQLNYSFLPTDIYKYDTDTVGS